MEKEIESLKIILEDIFSYMGIDPNFTIEDSPESSSLHVQIWDGDLSFLIGYRGQCLKALKYYLGLALNRSLPSDDWVRVTADIEGYVERRKEKIEEITRSHIDKARFFGHEVHMPRMDPSERFVVHSYVSQYPDIVSESEGRGYSRHVVLKSVEELDQEEVSTSSREE